MTVCISEDLSCVAIWTKSNEERPIISLPLQEDPLGKSFINFQLYKHNTRQDYFQKSVQIYVIFYQQ